MTRQSNINETKLLELYNQGLNDSDIARACDISRYSVRIWRNKRGLPYHKTESPQKGETKEHPVPEQYICYMTLNLSFDREDVDTAVQRWNEGRSIHDIADELTRDPDEILCLMHSLGIDGEIEGRQRGGLN